jgi:hypothetical protein
MNGKLDAPFPHPPTDDTSVPPTSDKSGDSDNRGWEPQDARWPDEEAQ